jgi:hypothetical protein
MPVLLEMRSNVGTVQEDPKRLQDLGLNRLSAHYSKTPETEVAELPMDLMAPLVPVFVLDKDGSPMPGIYPTVEVLRMPPSVYGVPSSQLQSGGSPNNCADRGTELLKQMAYTYPLMEYDESGLPIVDDSGPKLSFLAQYGLYQLAEEGKLDTCEAVKTAGFCEYTLDVSRFAQDQWEYFMKMFLVTALANQFCAATCGLCAVEDIPELNLKQGKMKAYGAVRGSSIENPVLTIPTMRTDTNGLFLPIFLTSQLGVGLWHMIVRVGDKVATDRIFFTTSVDNFLQSLGVNRCLQHPYHSAARHPLCR